MGWLQVFKNIDVNLKANDGLSALSYAIQGQNIKVVEMIGKKVKSGGDKNGLLMTVVEMFIEFKFTDPLQLQSFVQAVLKIKGVDVNFKNSQGQTALMYLVSKNTYNSDERIETILNTSEEIITTKGFDLNAQDNDGKTALMFFIEKNPENNYDNFIVEKILKTNGVNVNLKDTSGKTALFYAVIANNSTITEAILKIKGVDVKDNSGKTALFYANEPEMAELLLRYKIPVDEVDNYGKTALFYAPPKLIAPLVEGGAVVTIVDNEGNTVVMDIIKKLDNGRIERSHELLGILMEILKKVPDMDISSFKNQKGYSVITFLFSIELDTEMIKQVLEYCYEYIAQNQFLFNHVYEVEYYITYIENEMKKKKENTEEFKNIIESLELWKKHISVIPGSVGAGNASKRFSEMAINEYPSLKKTKPKFGGRPRRSYIKKKSQSATGANLRRRRSKRKTTVRCSPSLKHP